MTEMLFITAQGWNLDRSCRYWALPGSSRETILPSQPPLIPFAGAAMMR